MTIKFKVKEIERVNGDKIVEIIFAGVNMSDHFRFKASNGVTILRGIRANYSFVDRVLHVKQYDRSTNTGILTVPREAWPLIRDAIHDINNQAQPNKIEVLYMDSKYAVIRVLETNVTEGVLYNYGRHQVSPVARITCERYPGYFDGVLYMHGSNANKNDMPFTVPLEIYNAICKSDSFIVSFAKG